MRYIISFKNSSDLCWIHKDFNGHINLTKLDRKTLDFKRVQLNFQFLPRIIESLVNNYNYISVNDCDKIESVKELKDFDDVIHNLTWIGLKVIYE